MIERQEAERHIFATTIVVLFFPLQEKLGFDNGLLAVLQPLHAIMGIEFRQSSSFD